MFNPVIASKNIKEEFISYIETRYRFIDQGLNEQFKNELNKIISSELFLEINDVFKKGKSISELIEEGILSPLFINLEKNKPDNKLYSHVLPINRPLYEHQENAIRKIVDGQNLVISTGTGSGKTNCFLIPVINELLREQEKKTLDPGVRALFIYPMNALANDQIKNLRKVLMYYPSITFGVYNGATEEDDESANSLYEAMFSKEEIPELRNHLSNEMLSRKQMKNSPPHILFTNYAMLEHLLFRPNDDVLFSNSDFKYVVLDEAHIYSGATGIETAYLLRRLKARIHSSRNVQFILTSATLGTGVDSDSDIVDFATNLCGEKFNKNNIIRATREKYSPNPKPIYFDNSLFNELADENNSIYDVLIKNQISYDTNKKENELLFDLINNSALYNNFRIYSKPVDTFEDIKNHLNLDTKTAISFIYLCTKAQKNHTSLIDARYHFFIRCLEGCYMTFNKNQKLFLTRQKNYLYKDKTFAVFEVSICNHCGNIAIVGVIENDFLVQTSRFDNIKYFYLLDLENNEIIDDEEIETSDDTNNKGPKRYYLCPECGKIIDLSKQSLSECPNCKSLDLIKIVEATNLESGPRCGNCHRGVYSRLYLGNDAATSVLATALYEELPEYTVVDNDSKINFDSNIFLSAVKKTKNNNKKIRQFLVFSDSRQEAAKFACYLEKSYQEFLRRRGICQLIKSKHDELIQHEISVLDFVTYLKNLFSSKKTFANNTNDSSNLLAISNNNAWVAILNEIARANSPTSLTSLGILQFEYLGNDRIDIINELSNKYHVTSDNIKNLLNLLIFEIIKVGAICPNDDTDINDNDREYIFYSPSQRVIKKVKAPEEDSNKTISQWSPRNRQGKNDDYYVSAKLYYVMKTLKVDQKEAVNFLNDYFDYLTDEQNPYHLRNINNENKYVLRANTLQIKVHGDPKAKWYRCKRCGHISQFSLNHQCTVLRCDGRLEEISTEELVTNNHYANLYFNNKLTPLFIKEHTAQLSKKEGAEYQEKFIKKEINALSCSTTFEMGVDVGDLETVFLRNIPPLPSNYSQRAGRAGRSINAAAYALTYAKLSSHDLSFYRNPIKMISGSIIPPIFKIENEKIARRHIYAIALSKYFSLYPELYNSNHADKFINEKNYKSFIEWLNTKPIDLKDLLIKSLPQNKEFQSQLGIHDFQWLNDFIGNDGVFTNLIKEYEKNIDIFNDFIKEYKDADNLGKASKIQNQLRLYKINQLIEFLARGNILPRYGFPVDTIELEQRTTAKNLDKLRLTRDLQIAIAEYAPSSEIIADGKLYTSRYIKKSLVDKDKKEWQIGYIGRCSNKDCQTINYSITPIGNNNRCVACGQLLNKMFFDESIDPKSGFATEEQAKEVPLSKQEKNYKSEDFYIGNQQAKLIIKNDFKINNIGVSIESTTNDTLLVRSSTFFYVCNKCGFSYSAEEIAETNKKNKLAITRKARTINIEKTHKNLFGNNCSNKILNKYYLHHTFNTDVAKINFDYNTSDLKTMQSVMYAILYAFTDELNIERRDVKACLSKTVLNKTNHYSIIIYDAVPGGAGHSRRLVTKDGKMLNRILNKALMNMKDCKCNPSCYNCLRSYDNQKIHDNLDRNLAIEFLQSFEGGEIEILNNSD